MTAPKISLDQWATLVAVVEAGTYARAAQRLHKSQSTLTYAVQKLERLLGVAVFEKHGRKAELTPVGEMLYRRGKALVEGAARLEHGAGVLAQGWEPRIRLAAEIIFPTWLLLHCLDKFGREHPDTQLELVESVLGGTDEALTGRTVDLAIGSRVPPGFMGDALASVKIVCVASPQHPLHRIERALTMQDLREHRHLVIRDSGAQRSRSSGWLNETRWTVSHKATSIRAAVMGLGYAWYPEEAIREELEHGSLRRLPLREGAERHDTLYLIFADPDTTGPGARRLADIITRETARAWQHSSGTGGDAVTTG